MDEEAILGSMHPVFTLAQLRALIAVAEGGSFSAAAAKLSITQSGLSQSIGALEEILGVALLIRGRDGVTPTDVGETVVVEARQALEAARRIRLHAAEASGADKGVLKVATVRSASRRLVPRALSAYRIACPNVEISLYEGSDDEVREWVSSGASDVGLTSATGEGLVAQPLSEDAFLFVARLGHRLLSRGPVDVAALADEPFLMSSDGCEPAIQALFRDVSCEPKILLRVRDIVALMAMVRESIGVTIVPEMALPPGELEDLRWAPIRTSVRRTLLTVRRDETMPARVERFIQALGGSLEGTRRPTPERVGRRSISRS